MYFSVKSKIIVKFEVEGVMMKRVGRSDVTDFGGVRRKSLMDVDKMRVSSFGVDVPTGVDFGIGIADE